MSGSCFRVLPGEILPDRSALTMLAAAWVAWRQLGHPRLAEAAAPCPLCSQGHRPSIPTTQQHPREVVYSRSSGTGVSQTFCEISSLIVKRKHLNLSATHLKLNLCLCLCNCCKTFYIVHKCKFTFPYVKTYSTWHSPLQNILIPINPFVEPTWHMLKR